MSEVRELKQGVGLLPVVALGSGEYTLDRLDAEIGDVLAGRAPGRRAVDDITVYKSLGHAVQDLAAAAWLHQTLRSPT